VAEDSFERWQKDPCWKNNDSTSLALSEDLVNRAGREQDQDGWMAKMARGGLGRGVRV